MKKEGECTGGGGEGADPSKTQPCEVCAVYTDHASIQSALSGQSQRGRKGRFDKLSLSLLCSAL